MIREMTIGVMITSLWFQAMTLNGRLTRLEKNSLLPNLTLENTELFDARNENEGVLQPQRRVLGAAGSGIKVRAYAISRRLHASVKPGTSLFCASAPVFYMGTVSVLEHWRSAYEFTGALQVSGVGRQIRPGAAHFVVVGLSP